jgi:CheY-like chemotaxis protein
MAIRDLESDLSRHTPRVAMTAAAIKGDCERCLEAGMDAYVAKRIDPDQLSKTLFRVTLLAV